MNRLFIHQCAVQLQLLWDELAECVAGTSPLSAISGISGRKYINKVDLNSTWSPWKDFHVRILSPPRVRIVFDQLSAHSALLHCYTVTRPVHANSN